MKLAVKSAGLCASSAFLVTALPAFFEQVAPIGLSKVPLNTLQGMDVFEMIAFSLGGAAIAGAIGYIIGDILANPQGSKEIKRPSGKNSSPILAETGDETFLKDLEPVSSASLPETAETTDN
jgi:hypothetical protein